MGRALKWAIENTIFAGLTYYAITTGNDIANYAVNIWIGICAGSLALVHLASWTGEAMYKNYGEKRFAVSFVNRMRLRGTAVPYALYVGVEVAWSSLFITQGWYYLAAMQIYATTFLIYVFDRELIKQGMKTLEERGIDLNTAPTE